MKTKFLALASLFAAASFACAAPLTAPTTVHSKPDEKSPTIALLNAGTQTVTAAGTAGVPSGWMAVELPGPFTGYVQNKDLAKSLDVLPGAPIYLAPKIESGVLTVAEKDDKTTIDGVVGKWSRLVLDKKIVGYIRTTNAAPALPAIATAPAVAPINTTPAPMTPPVPAVAHGVSTGGQSAPMINLSDSGAGLPRSFQGRFVSTRRPLAPRRPYDWALNDEAGKRYAYLDVSKLLQTEQIEKYTDHMVVVYGAAKASPDGKDILIQVESLQLK
jgi:hypothetical protein